MLSYQHAYHAGSFADVHKHLALFGLLGALQAKDSAITLVDTHAGRGLYPLAERRTQQNGEYRDGIQKLWDRRAAFGDDTLLGQWLADLAGLQKDTRLQVYPGSPWWFGAAQRSQDLLSLFELHPGEHQALDSQQPLARKRIRRIHGDGLAGLVKMQPVATPRLCVLIDPSYELKTEYREIVRTFKAVVRKTRHAVLAVWYPLLPAARHEPMLDTLARSGIPKIWQSELTHHAPAKGDHGMYGSGLLLLNPPWQLDRTLDTAFADLADVFGEGARHDSRWLTGE
ncbi:MAG: hypothetical protein CMP08_01255 [Xanthomonadales bacterium]|nr:hypothetical protein [Xanthomonadales bacterium]